MMDSHELIHRTQTQQPLVDSVPRRPPPRSVNIKALKSPIQYMLRSQRLVCILVGIAMSAMFFNRFPISTPPLTRHHQGLVFPTSVSTNLPTRRILYETSRDEDKFGGRREMGGASGRVPLGIKRKRLRVLVTGGAGFVGSHLVDRLMERGDSVIVVDNFFTGRKGNVVHHLGNPRFELIRHDVVEPILLEVDQIYHLACPASPVHYKFNPVKTIISFYFLSHVWFP
ncbi:hypothetical protein QYF36_020808 [Acer negundo]|nr:hypothetical protein QYF36_020808 [Acer negundo]